MYSVQRTYVHAIRLWGILLYGMGKNLGTYIHTYIHICSVDNYIARQVRLRHDEYTRYLLMYGVVLLYPSPMDSHNVHVLYSVYNERIECVCIHV